VRFDRRFARTFNAVAAVLLELARCDCSKNKFMVFALLIRTINSMSTEQTPEKKDEPSSENAQASAGSESKPADTPKSSDAAATVAKSTAVKPKPPGPPGPPRKKWDPKLATPTFADRMAWRLVFFATGMAVVLVVVIIYLMMRTKTEAATVKLGEEYVDRVNNYSIHPPYNWALNDPHDGRNFYIMGPRERGMTPMVLICLDVAPGDLESYLKTYKSDLQKLEPTVNWISDELARIDKTDGRRLEYECDNPTDDGKTARIHCVQYIIPDPPRFYRVTCTVRADLFQNYLERFEASARSFKRTPLNAPAFNTVPK
jgi:hypothetical protein